MPASRRLALLFCCAVLMISTRIITVAADSTKCDPNGTTCWTGDCTEALGICLCKTACWYDRTKCTGCDTAQCDGLGCSENCSSGDITDAQMGCNGCLPGRVGQWCDYPITCNTTHGVPDLSPHSTGLCLSCLDDDWVGPNCDIKNTCVPKQGNPEHGISGSTGHCLSCNPGYCGRNCEQSASCKHGQLGATQALTQCTCASCDALYWGANCTSTVDCYLGPSPSSPLNLPDDGPTGHGFCKSCASEFLLPNCRECTDAARWGPRCIATATCVHGVGTPDVGFENSTGACTGLECLDGYYGANCNQPCKCTASSLCFSGTQGNGGCACPAGSHSVAVQQPDGTTMFDCQLCVAGQYMSSPPAPSQDPTSCVACSGTTWSKTGATVCDQPCPADMTCQDGVAAPDVGNLVWWKKVEFIASICGTIGGFLLFFLKVWWEKLQMDRQLRRALGDDTVQRASWRSSLRAAVRKMVPCAERCIDAPVLPQTAVNLVPVNGEDYVALDA